MIRESKEGTVVELGDKFGQYVVREDSGVTWRAAQRSGRMLINYQPVYEGDRVSFEVETDDKGDVQVVRILTVLAKVNPRHRELERSIEADRKKWSRGASEWPPGIRRGTKR